ncbi:MAG TPA: hypothetical protein VF984_03550 [Actinomycetota bacterium]
MFQHPDPRWVDHGWWWGFFGGFVPLLLFVILIGVLVWAVLRVSSHPRTGSAAAGPLPPAPPVHDPVLEEVRFQYARGQITREEYVQRSHDLGGSVPEATPSPAPPAESPPAGNG